MHQSMLPFGILASPASDCGRGVVYTRPWVVDLLLDLADYSADADLVDAVAVEPAAGEGAFLVAMARRLIASCERQRRPLTDCNGSLIAYEIDERSAGAAKRAVVGALEAMSIGGAVARGLAECWVRTGDYLLEAATLPKADFIVGNPPYVRLEDIPAGLAGSYRRLYPTMRGRADLYVAFFEAALRQLKAGGVCGYICADRWMLNQYGAKLRRLIATDFAVRFVVEMHDADAFDEDVSAYPALTIIRRATQGRVVVARARAPAEPVETQGLAEWLRATGEGPDGRATPPIVGAASIATWFRGADPWPCSSPGRLALIRRLEDEFDALEDGEHTKVGIGVATGCDRVFITRDPGLVEPDRLLPIALASDTATGRLEWSGHYLVDPWGPEGLVGLPSFPKLMAYLDLHEDALRGRHTAKNNPGGWYRTIDRVTHALRGRRKLYIPDIKDEFNPVLDEGTTYPHHNLYYITSDRWDLEVLGGLLLSSVAQLFIEAYGVRMRGGYLRFQAQYLRRVRVPDPRGIDRPRARELSESFRARDRDRATRAALDIYRVDPHELEAARGH